MQLLSYPHKPTNRAKNLSSFAALVTAVLLLILTGVCAAGHRASG